MIKPILLDALSAEALGIALDLQGHVLTSLTDRLKASVKKLTNPHILSLELSLRDSCLIVTEAPANSISKDHPVKISCSLLHIKSILQFEGFSGGGIGDFEYPNTQLQVFGELLFISLSDLPPSVVMVLVKEYKLMRLIFTSCGGLQVRF